MKVKRKLFAFFIVLVMSFTLIPVVPSYATFDGLNIAVYADSAVDAKTVTALCQAFARMGHNPMAIAEGDLIHGRLNTTNFDVLVIPSGCNGTQYDVNETISGNEQVIKDFVDDGGGLIAIGAAASLLCQNSINSSMAMYVGYTTSYVKNEAGSGMGMIHVSNNSFSSTNEKYTTFFGSGIDGFANTPVATVIAHYEATGGYSTGTPAILAFPYGYGQVCLVGPELELEEFSEEDFAAWDNVYNSFYDPESELPLLAKIVEYVDTGSVQNDTVISEPILTGKRIAVFTENNRINGGSWPGFLPAVFRSIEYSGNTPIAVNSFDVKAGKLTTNNFDAIVFPGGYAYNYSLANIESAVCDFVLDGGGIMGICAGSYYLSNYVNWEGVNYNYYVDIYEGTAIGPLNDIAPWPGRAMTTVYVDDDELGIDDEFYTTYYGGGYFSGGTYDPSGIFSYNGDYSGTNAIIRKDYGFGRAVLLAPHLEAQEGTYIDDWCWWDNFEYDSDNYQLDYDSEWDALDAYYDWISDNTYSYELLGDGTTLAVKRTAFDTVDDTFTDTQRKDYNYSTYDYTREYSDGLYTVGAGDRMELEGFGKGYGDVLSSVTLKVKYQVESGLAANSYIRWRMNDSSTWYNTSIQPVSGQTNVMLTYDLKAAGVDTISEVQKLCIEYTNNDASGKKISFDYVQVQLSN